MSTLRNSIPSRNRREGRFFGQFSGIATRYRSDNISSTNVGFGNGTMKKLSLKFNTFNEARTSRLPLYIVDIVCRWEYDQRHYS